MTNPTTELVDVLQKLSDHRKYNKLEVYEPYPYQIKFHNAKGWDTNIPAQVKSITAANQVGKTLSACVEDAIHLTGLYPDWWKGHRFGRPIQAVIGTYTNELTRDLLQAELCGDPFEPEALGTGWIPKKMLTVKPTQKAGVPGAFDTVLVKSAFGGFSKISFRSFDIGEQKFFGRRVDLYHLDEEPPVEIFNQCVRGTLSRKDSLINLTFTAERGKTELYQQLKTEDKIGFFTMTATWDDCPHFSDPKVREREEAKIPERLRNLRTKGIPVMGEGLIFPFSDKELMCAPFEIPRYWPRIKAIDYGVSHAFALVCAAWDRDTSTWYIYDAKKKADLNISAMAAMVNATHKWIPVVWPHDLNKRDPRSGKAWKQILSEPPYECNMLPMVFSNPTDDAKQESGGQAVWPGIFSMREWMEEGRFKVFNHLEDWFEEKGFYHEGKNGQPVRINDDIMSATRYGFQMRRYATTKPHRRASTNKQLGLRNW